MGPEQGNSIAEQGSAEPDSARGPVARLLLARSAVARLASIGCAVTILAAALIGTTASRGSLSRRSPTTSASSPAIPDLPPLLHGGRPTFVLFQSGTSSLEREFLAG